MAGKTLHIISHSHWDREWYMPFELHRRRLVKLLDGVLDTLKTDPKFGSFHLDGQVIPLLDYLQIRPERRDELKQAAQSRRCTVGPWYVLQDEYLTSGEAQVRNLLYGTRVAKEFGPVLKVGYLADAFGNIGQMPQLLAGFGINNAVFGRGLNQLDPNCPADRPQAERGYPSELTWRGSDGTPILAVMTSNWYNNAMDIPTEPTACVQRFRDIIAACERYATTSQLLGMNGCDHTPCQLNISSIIATGQAEIDDVIVHSRLDDYVAAVAAEAHDLPEHQGELRSEFTSGWYVLTDVLSTRLYLKQANWRCQHLLERYVEPLEALTASLPHPMPADRGLRNRCWTKLMECHPHDSICGCSADPVHREMETRFAKVEALAGQLMTERMDALAGAVDTSGAADGELPIVVYNPLGFERDDEVEMAIDWPEKTPVAGVALRDLQGRDIPVEIVEPQTRSWKYVLPDDRFRYDFWVERVVVRFTAHVPAFGHTTYFARALAAEPVEQPATQAVLENAAVKVELRPGLRLDVTDKATGRVWRGLNRIQLTGDCGDEYNYRIPEHDILIEPSGAGDETAYWQVEPGARQAQGLDILTIPATDDESDDAAIAISMCVALPTDGPRIEITANLHNEGAENVRLRAYFTTDAVTDTANADGQFEVVSRKITPYRYWQNPSNCQPCQDFIDVSDEKGGLTIANRGLPEYEVLRDGRNTIAVTLLRCTGRVGDWAQIDTPDAQCDGENLAEYAIIPHVGNLPASGAAELARAYNSPLQATQTTAHAGDLPPVKSALALTPSSLALSAVRIAEDRDAFIVRFYNPYAQAVDAELNVGLPFNLVRLCNLDEEPQGEPEPISGVWKTTVGPKQIVTLELS